MPSRYVAECSFCGEFVGDDERNFYKAVCPSGGYANRIVIETKELLVLPSIGSIVEGHMLICTREHFVSFGAFLRAGGELDGLREVLGRVRAQLMKLFESPAIVFEHGSSLSACGVGCGELHAHLHVVPVDVDLISSVREIQEWAPCSLKRLSQFDDNDAYLFFEDSSGHGSVHTVREAMPSQFLRRLLAAKVGRPDEWDWREYPRTEWVEGAVRRFRSVE